jgi:hypothetical protein
LGWRVYGNGGVSEHGNRVVSDHGNGVVSEHGNGTAFERDAIAICGTGTVH